MSPLQFYTHLFHICKESCSYKHNSISQKILHYLLHGKTISSDAFWQNSIQCLIKQIVYHLPVKLLWVRHFYRSLIRDVHCVKSVSILSYSGPCFLALGLNVVRKRGNTDKTTRNTDIFYVLVIVFFTHFLRTFYAVVVALIHLSCLTGFWICLWLILQELLRLVNAISEDSILYVIIFH